MFHHKHDGIPDAESENVINDEAAVSEQQSRNTVNDGCGCAAIGAAVGGVTAVAATRGASPRIRSWRHAAGSSAEDSVVGWASAERAGRGGARVVRIS